MIFIIKGGRRSDLTLAHIMQFGTGTDEEPVLGFMCPPSLNFTPVFSSFLPTANMCINRITIPHPTRDHPLPQQEQLFGLYDLAFLNTYFGNL
jgi:hypothetical protein